MSVTQKLLEILLIYTPLMSHLFVLRLLSASDVETAHEMEARSYPADEAASLEDIRFRQAFASPYFYGAFSIADGSLIGFVNSTRCGTFEEESMSLHDPTGAILAIHSVCVDEKHRRRGIARSMLKQYATKITIMQKNNNNNAITQFVLIAKKHLVPFYESCSFVCDGLSAIVHGAELWYDLHRDVTTLPRTLMDSPVDVGSTRWLKLQTLTYLDSDSKENAWDRAIRTTKKSERGADAVAILATVDEAIICVKQFRPPINSMTIELPAGLIDAGEAPGLAAARELLEETNYVGKVEHVSNEVFLSPGLSNESVVIVKMSIEGKGVGEMESSEVGRGLEVSERSERALRKTFLKVWRAVGLRCVFWTVSEQQHPRTKRCATTTELTLFHSIRLACLVRSCFIKNAPRFALCRLLNYHVLHC